MISAVTVLGDNAEILLDIGGGQPLAFTLGIHVARRNFIEMGRHVRVSLVADAIHVMPADGQAAGPPTG